jgi:hypothetical protein
MSNFTVARFSASECDALYASAPRPTPSPWRRLPSMVNRQRTFIAPLSFGPGSERISYSSSHSVGQTRLSRAMTSRASM